MDVVANRENERLLYVQIIKTTKNVIERYGQKIEQVRIEYLQLLDLFKDADKIEFKINPIEDWRDFKEGMTEIVFNIYANDVVLTFTPEERPLFDDLRTRIESVLDYNYDRIELTNSGHIMLDEFLQQELDLTSDLSLEPFVLFTSIPITNPNPKSEETI